MNPLKKEVKTTEAPAPAGPYSQGITAGQFVFVSGQRPVDPKTGEIVLGVKEQARQCIQNVEAVLKAAGSSLENIVRLDLYLSDIGNFAAVNEVYREMIPSPAPARTTVSCSLRGIEVEICAIALREE